MDRLLGPRLGHTPSNWPRRVQKLVERVAHAEQRDALELLDELASSADPRFLDALLDAATIGHTAFFRHAEQFAELERALPEVARERSRPVRIWCAGCSTGEEAFSLALTAERVGVACQILATDVNPVAVRMAREGRYSATHRGLLPGPAGALEWVAPNELRAMIRFEVASITDAAPPRDFQAVDFVFCRNVLIYFQHERVPQLLEGLAAALVPGGALVVSPVDALLPAPASLERSGKPGWFKLARNRGLLQRIATRQSHPEPPAPKPVAVEAPPPPPTPLDRAAQLLGSGRSHDAEVLLTSLLNKEPDSGAAWFLLGEALYQRGEIAQARAAFLRASRATPTDDSGIDGEAVRAAAARKARAL